MRPPVTTEEELLYEILKRLDILVEKLIPEKPEIKIEKPPEIKVKTKPTKVCKYCNKVHERPIDYAICARKHKKGV